MLGLPAAVLGIKVLIRQMNGSEGSGQRGPRMVGRITLGGIVKIDRDYFCLTAEHAFSEPSHSEAPIPDSEPSGEDDGCEWSIREEDLMDESEVDSVDMTSRGSRSP